MPFYPRPLSSLNIHHVFRPYCTAYYKVTQFCAEKDFVGVSTAVFISKLHGSRSLLMVSKKSQVLLFWWKKRKEKKRKGVFFLTTSCFQAQWYEVSQIMILLSFKWVGEPPFSVRVTAHPVHLSVRRYSIRAETFSSVKSNELSKI